MISLGAVAPFALSPAPTTAEISAFAAQLTIDPPGWRADRAKQAGSFVSAVAALADTDSFQLTDLGAAQDPENRRLRNLLNGSWNPERLRRLLVSLAPLDRVRVFAIEYVTIGPYDVAGLHAVGDNFSHPIGWQRVPVPLPDLGADGVPQEISDGETQVISTLLDVALSDYGAVEPWCKTPYAPLIIREPALGDNASLRAAIANRLPEYLIEVRADYDDVRLHRHPYERRLGQVAIADHFDLSRVPTAQPRQVLAGLPPRSSEYAIGLVDGSNRRYAVGRPGLFGAGLAGQRLHQRMIELADLMTSLPELLAADSLRLAAFNAPNEDAWLKSSLLLSAYQALRTSPLAPRVRARRSA
jgi:hypothetical protein